jgi:hypothetical protein
MLPLYQSILFAILAIVKFLFTPFTMMAFLGKDAGRVEFATIVSTTGIGATVGVLFFYFLGKRFFVWWGGSRKKPNQRTFTKQRRRMIRIKMRFGLFGIVLVSGLISVPVSAILAARFYKHQWHTPFWLILGFWFWALFLTSLAWVINLF